MRAVLFEQFQSTPTVQNVPDPTPRADGVVIEVNATGICRSDWHGWMGHDVDIALPHVPGHELAGTIVATGANVQKCKIGDRVTVPFVAGCGHCPECNAGHQQVCHNQFQPGFTHWGSFAQYVSIQHADLNIVPLPPDMAFDTAASLGCRFATAFHALIDQARLQNGQWVAVHGCGGVGLSAIMIANALGAKIIAIDVATEPLNLAKSFGAQHAINAHDVANVPEAIHEVTKGGAHVSLDALGHPETCQNSIQSLKRRGKHIQVGLMLAEQSTQKVPMDKIIAHELEILGSHGMQAHRYADMLSLIRDKNVDPARLITSRISLEAAPDVLTSMDSFKTPGVSMITSF